MKKLLVLFSVIILFSSFSTVDINHGISKAPPVSLNITGKFIEANMEKLATMKIKELEKFAGRKLKLKEKIAFKIYQFKLRKDLKNHQNDEDKSKGKTAFILGLISLIAFFIPYVTLASLPLAILAVIIGSKAKKENPKDSKANTGFMLGLISLGLFALALILVIAIIASGIFWI